MKINLFIRLYLLIVSSIIIIGVGINWFWQSDYIQTLSEQNKPVNETRQKSNYKQYELLIKAIALQLEKTVVDNTFTRKNHINQLSQALNLEIELIGSDAIPQSAFEKSATVVLNNEFNGSGSNAIYYHLKQSSQILKVEIPPEKTEKFQSSQSQFETLFLVLFYGLIALVVFYWIWPLSKDLNQLQRALKGFDSENWQSKLDFPNTSPISHLARAYNQLLAKIKRMLENEKSMANSISHELRTPLARIRFALQMAKESKDPEFIIQQIQSAEDDIEEMNQLISEILSYASIDNHAFRAQFSKGDLGALIELLILRLEKNYPKHHIIFNNLVKTKSVLCDSILIERALQNLIVNACKYGDKNIEVLFDENENGFQVKVANDGDMIEQPQKENIFDAYYQIPSDEKSTGFGLGLSLVKRIADLHNGVIILQQSVLGGAEFVFKWPKIKPS